MKERRSARLAEEIREEVADILRTRVKDPRIGFITITRVELVRDVSLARIFVGVLGDEKQREQALSGLERAAGFVRRELGQRIRLRHTPELIFQYDRGIEATDRVARLLSEASGSVSKSDAEPEEGE